MMELNIPLVKLLMVLQVLVEHMFNMIFLLIQTLLHNTITMMVAQELQLMLTMVVPTEFYRHLLTSHIMLFGHMM